MSPPRRMIPEEVSHLGDDQLLAVLVQPGQPSAETVRRVREACDRMDGVIGIAGATPTMLRQAGLTASMACRIAAACEVGRRVAAAKRRTRPSCRTPEEVAALMAPELVARRSEELWLLPLDVNVRLIGSATMVSRGDIDGTDASPRAILRVALSLGAASCILCHQHPSGDPQPSAADRDVTRRIAAAGRIIGIDLKDHVVIGDAGRFASLRRSDPGLFI